MTPDKRELIELCEVVMDGTACGDPAFSLVDYEKAAKSVAHALKRILTEPQAGAKDFSWYEGRTDPAVIRDIVKRKKEAQAGTVDELNTDELHCERIEVGRSRGMYKVFETMTSEDICLCWKESRAKRIIEALQSRPASEGEGFVRVPKSWLTAIRDEIGWRGCGENDHDYFYCEHCHQSNEDCTKIVHDANCLVTRLDNVIAAATKEGT